MEEISVEVWVVDLEAVAHACGRALAAMQAWCCEAPLLAGSLHVMACSCRHGLHSGARPLTGDAMV
jgi:hypothetical protein